MGALVPSFLFDFESEMQRITEFEFARMSASDILWWRKLCKVRPSGKKREIIAFLLSNAQIYDQGYTGGNVVSDEMAAVYQEYDLRNAGAMLELSKNQVTDNDGDGFDFAGEWSANMGALGAYWPQFLSTQFLLSGATLTGNPVVTSNLAYDGVAFFNASPSAGHPYNPKQTAFGFYANWFTGAPSLPYPGAVPIDESVPLETALKNIQLVISYVKTIKMPNGTTPRFLRPMGILCAPRLETRVRMLTKGSFLPFSAASGGGAADTEDKTAIFGLETIVADEFAGATTGDGKSADLIWYLICETIQSSNLGGIAFVDREPFRVKYYTGDGGGGTGVDAVLDRQRTLEWHIDGRNVIGPGHPYSIFRADNT
jgi:hypothetical protein